MVQRLGKWDWPYVECAGILANHSFQSYSMIIYPDQLAVFPEKRGAQHQKQRKLRFAY